MRSASLWPSLPARRAVGVCVKTCPCGEEDAVGPGAIDLKWAWLTAAALGFLVLLAGLAYSVGIYDMQLSRCTGPGVSEGDLVAVGGSWWPPGTRCFYRDSDGPRVLLITPGPTVVLAVGASFLVGVIGPISVGMLWRRWYESLFV